MLRPFPHRPINRTEEFKSSDIIAIGWPLLGDLTGTSRDKLKSILSRNLIILQALLLAMHTVQSTYLQTKCK